MPDENRKHVQLQFGCMCVIIAYIAGGTVQPLYKHRAALVCAVVQIVCSLVCISMNTTTLFMEPEFEIYMGIWTPAPVLQLYCFAMFVKIYVISCF